MGSIFLFIVIGIGSLASMLFIGFMLRSQQGLMSATAVDYQALTRMFLERTGFRLAEMPDAPVDEQARVLVARQSDPVNAQQGYEVRYVLQKYGKVVHHQTFTRLASVSASWTVPLSEPAPVGFHILKAVKAEPAYPQRIAMNDPRWDGAFQIYGQNPEALQQLLPSSGLLELLESSVAVDLRVLSDRVVFLDPANRNVMAALGGRVGMAMVGGDPTQLSEMTIAAYNHITDVMLMASETGR